MDVGINIIGMPLGEHGLGQCMRDRIDGMSRASIPINVMEMNYSSLKSKGDYPYISNIINNEPKYSINLWCLNLPMILLAKRDRPELFEGRYNIISPFWEFTDIPQRHLEGLNLVDELWVSTSFLSDVFMNVTDKTITKMPLYVSLPKFQKNLISKKSLGYSSKNFIFLYVFDANSLVARKDPEAAILAFISAFQEMDCPEARLLIKYKYEHGSMAQDSRLNDLRRLGAMDPRVKFIDCVMSREEILSLIANCDAYVSPHRAEGMGRTILEAMLLGKPVMATAWSGNVDFVQSDYSVPLDYALVPVGEDAIGEISPDFHWASVDIEGVARGMRELASNPKYAREMGERGRRELTKVCGAKVFGSAVSSWISNHMSRI